MKWGVATPIAEGNRRVTLDHICETPSTVPGTWQVLRGLLCLWLLVLLLLLYETEELLPALTRLPHVKRK